MRNFKLTVQYDGTDYHGWQIQQKNLEPLGKEKTIQGIIEKVLEKILQEEVRVQGAGRTDAGVHALAQIANFKTNSKLAAISIQRALNALLPNDIVISNVREVDFDFNARFDAHSKTYRYTILNQRNNCVFTKLYQYHIPYELDIRKMRQEARSLIGKHDFKSFQASDRKKLSSIRCIKRLKIKKEGHLINIEVEADGLLYNMVRNIVGTLIEIGSGKLPVGSIRRILKGKNRKLAGPTAPAKGLCLVRVKY